MSKLPKPVFNDWLHFLKKHDVPTLASLSPIQVMKKREKADEEAEEKKKKKEKKY